MLVRCDVLQTKKGDEEFGLPNLGNWPLKIRNSSLLDFYITPSKYYAQWPLQFLWTTWAFGPRGAD